MLASNLLQNFTSLLKLYPKHESTQILIKFDHIFNGQIYSILFY